MPYLPRIHNKEHILHANAVILLECVCANPCVPRRGEYIGIELQRVSSIPENHRLPLQLPIEFRMISDRNRHEETTHINVDNNTEIYHCKTHGILPIANAQTLFACPPRHCFIALF